jgi:sugar lactone lactonase YvrE
MDMLHDSPLGMGIAWEQGNAYWVFDGWHGALTRYDFVLDHGAGGTDHSDAVVRRYAELEVARVPNVPSHLEYDAGAALLYVADTGHHRIAVLDTTSGSAGAETFPNYDGSDQRRVDGARVETLVDTSENGVAQPSGLALTADHVFVTDAVTGAILAYDRAGELVDYLLTGLPPGALMGLAIDDEGRIYFVDSINNAVLRVAPK